MHGNHSFNSDFSMLYSVTQTCKLSLAEVKQEDHKFEALLVFIMTPCLQKGNIDLEIRIMDTHSHEKEKKRWGRVEGAGQMVQWLSN